jgi:adenylate cyclase
VSGGGGAGHPAAPPHASGPAAAPARRCRRLASRRPSLAWFWLTLGCLLSVNLLAGVTTRLTVDLMRSLSAFAVAVRARDLAILPAYQCAMYLVATTVIALYLWPLIAYFRGGAAGPASVRVQRRVVGGPLFLAAASFIPWVFGSVFFPLLTVYQFGRWSPELASQHVLSPLVNGFLATATGYLLVEWIFRVQVVPVAFPHGRLTAVPGARPLGVQARLLIFLLAVAFVPLFTLLGLVRAAATRLAGGMPVDALMRELTKASEATFAVYVLLGVGLTLLLGRTLTRPLAAMVAALRRVEAGDLGVEVPVGSGDEVGVLEDGVNAMVGALRDRQHIYQTFGRIVEPAVRDQLLAGTVARHGERRRATVLFCDLRGFTSIAEASAPEQVVETLNEFFTEMTSWVRACGGFVDKFIGDAMLVVFGLFAPDEEAAGGAGAGVRCALGMRERLDALNARRVAAGRSALAMAVSAHLGDVVAGTIGADDRHEYTVIGDTVNVAARLQQLCKERNHDLLVSATLYEAAHAGGLRCAVVFRDSVRLRGRMEPVTVYGIARGVEAAARV